MSDYRLENIAKDRTMYQDTSTTQFKNILVLNTYFFFEDNLHCKSTWSNTLKKLLNKR